MADAFDLRRLPPDFYANPFPYLSRAAQSTRR